MNSKRKLATFTTMLIGAIAGTVGYATPAAAADCASAVAAPAGLVLVLLDRSGSMADDCKLADGTTGRKWACAVENAKKSISGFDPEANYAHFIWQFRHMEGDTNPLTIVQKNGASGNGMCLAAAQTELDATLPVGPSSYDSDTPLAGAYCAAVTFLTKYATEHGLGDRRLYIKLESDGEENFTPDSDLCHGDPTDAIFAYHNPPQIITSTVPNTVDGLPVTSWKAKMYDAAITGVAHVYPNPAAFVPPINDPDLGPNLPVITNVTFIDQFIPPVAMNRRNLAAPIAVAAPFMSMASSLALAGLGQTTTSTDSPTVASLVSFFGGLAETTGSRLTRIGSGAAVVSGSPYSTHVISGDANDSGCVDAADFAIVKQAYGQRAISTNANAIRADLTADGVVNINDYLLLKAQYGKGCATNPGTPPVLANGIFGFDDSSRWSCPSASLAFTPLKHTEGSFSLKVAGSNYRAISSVPFSTSLFQGVTSKLALDVLIPAKVTNSYYGQVLFFVNAPSAGINNLPLGTVELSGRTRNVFSTITFTVPANVKTAMTTARSDFSLKVVVNAADPGYEIDNLRFVP